MSRTFSISYVSYILQSQLDVKFTFCKITVLLSLQRIWVSRTFLASRLIFQKLGSIISLTFSFFFKYIYISMEGICIFIDGRKFNLYLQTYSRFLMKEQQNLSRPTLFADTHGVQIHTHIRKFGHQRQKNWASRKLSKNHANMSNLEASTKSILASVSSPQNLEIVFSWRSRYFSLDSQKSDYYTIQQEKSQ